MFSFKKTLFSKRLRENIDAKKEQKEQKSIDVVIS